MSGLSPHPQEVGNGHHLHHHHLLHQRHMNRHHHQQQHLNTPPFVPRTSASSVSSSSSSVSSHSASGIPGMTGPGSGPVLPLASSRSTTITASPFFSVEFHVDDVRRRKPGSPSSSAFSSSSSSSDHTEYRVSVTTHFQRHPDCVIVVWRRFTQFKRLYSALNSSPLGRYAPLMTNCPEFPQKDAFKRFDPEVVEYRRRCFQALLDFIAFNQPLLESSEFVSFLVDPAHDNDSSSSSSSSLSSAAASLSSASALSSSSSPSLSGARFSSQDAQDDSIRSFLLGRYYDPHLAVGPALEPLRGQTVSFLIFMTSDIGPFLSVASQMANAGLKVQVISMEHNKAFVEAHKLTFLGLSAGDTYISLGEFRSASSSHMASKESKELRPTIEISVNHLNLALSLAKGSSLLCFAQGFPELVVATTISEVHRIPVIGLFNQPMHSTTLDQSLSILDLGKSKPLNISSLLPSLGDHNWKTLKSKINEWRTDALRISQIQANQWDKLLLEQVPVSYGISPSLFERPSDWPFHVDVAGYWFLETKKELRSRKKAIHPLASVSDSIVQFINSGPKPVFIGFGSSVLRDLSPEDRSKFFNLLMDCLREADLRAFVCFYSTGSPLVHLNDFLGPSTPNNTAPSASSSIYRLSVEATVFPFLWLFSHCQAIIHDGSTELTSHSLRAGVPVFLIPFNSQQTLTSVLVSRLGIGPTAIQASQLNAKNFSIALRRATTEKEVKIRAEMFGEQLRSEKGCLRTLSFISTHYQSYFKSRGLPLPKAPQSDRGIPEGTPSSLQGDGARKDTEDEERREGASHNGDGFTIEDDDGDDEEEEDEED